MITSSPLRTGAATTAAAAALLAVGLAPAAAHVTADATSTAAGGYSRVTFVVPNESDDAATDTVELKLPEDTPFGSVRTQPMEGWTAKVTDEKLATPVPVGEGQITERAATVTWTADGQHTIGPDEFQTFTISVGPLPQDEGQQVMLPVTQSYTDGRTVAWDQPMPENGEEPERPAPAITITAAEDGRGQGATPEATAPAETASSQDSSTGSAVGWTALVAGVLGLAAGIVALVRTSRRR